VEMDLGDGCTGEEKEISLQARKKDSITSEARAGQVLKRNLEGGHSCFEPDTRISQH